MSFEQYNECTVSSSSADKNCSSESDRTSSSSSSLRQLVSHKKTSGRKKFKETRHPIYRGVRARTNDKWVCEVREPNSKVRIWLGTHSTPEMAARAYDVAAIALRGKSALLNFEDSLWLLPRAKSSSAKDIQFAVGEASGTFPFPACTKASTITKKSMKSVTSKLSKRPVETAENLLDSVPATATFFDEEALYNMPALIASMAEGMLLEASGTFPFPACTKPSTITKKSMKSVTSKLSKRPVETAENLLDSVPATATFFDEEALYNMPALIASMAEGMLLDPPQGGYYFDDVEYNVDSSLWSE